jgi:ATP-dependent Lhr-like helicase
MARKQFRDIATICGLVFTGYPGKYKEERHLKANSQLFFNVFSEYDPNNLFLKQAYEEAYYHQLEETRLREVLNRIQQMNILLSRPEKATPFAFPIMIDRLRTKLTSEKLEDRIKKLQIQFSK